MLVFDKRTRQLQRTSYKDDTYTADDNGNTPTTPLFRAHGILNFTNLEPGAVPY